MKKLQGTKKTKEQKTVYAKRLPKIYKKKYTEKKLEKKVLKHIYIAQDKDFVHALFEKELNNIALNNDVFVHISESIKDPRLFNIKVLKKGYNHVVDIPDFAVKNQTGDSVYIAWEKELASADSKPFLPDITTKLNELLESIK